MSKQPTSSTAEQPEVDVQGPIDPLELTAEQKQKWDDTMSLMAWKAPGFRHIFYKLLSNNNSKYVAVPTKAVPVAATDGENILINPDTFFKYNLMERVFIAAHEIVHNVYNDVQLLHRCKASGKVPTTNGGSKPFDNMTMQKAMDYRINALLKESRIGECPKDGLCDPKIAGPTDSVYDIYEKLYKKKKEDGEGDAPGGFDIVMAPGQSNGKDPNQVANQRSAQSWAVQIAAAQKLEEMRSQGRMPGALSRMFKDILEPKIPWTEHIRAIFNRKVGSGSYNWRRPDRRFIVRDLHMPSRSGHAAGWIVVWGDTSGSISETEMNKYLAELAGIIEDVKPRRLTIVWCDSQIQRIDEVKDVQDLLDIKRRGVPGGGGTDVEPVFEWISKNNTELPEVFIGFTDGYVSFPAIAPSYHVIWADVGGTKYPWGDVVCIK